MNDDARFFFCISGFIGFCLTWILSLSIHGEILLASIHGTLGCLFFSLMGRFLLGIILGGAMRKILNEPSTEVVSSELDNSESKAKGDATRAMAETVAKSKPMVEAKV